MHPCSVYTGLFIMSSSIPILPLIACGRIILRAPNCIAPYSKTSYMMQIKIIIMNKSMV